MRILLPIILFLLTTSIQSIGQRNCGSVYNQAFIDALPTDVKDKLKKFNRHLEDLENNGGQSLSTYSATATVSSTDFILIPVV